VKTTGYITSTLDRWLIGEDLFWSRGSHATPRSAVRSWMHSRGHRRVIMHARFKEMGVGLVWGTPRHPHADGGIYTADFGFRRG